MQKGVFGALLIILVFASSCYGVMIHQDEAQGFDERTIVQLNEEIRKLHERIDSILCEDVRISNLASGTGTLYSIVTDSDGNLYKSSTEWTK